MKSKLKLSKGNKQVHAAEAACPAEPTWQDRLKNQMGSAAMSSIADTVHGKHANRGVEDARQLLSNLGMKAFTENDQAEVVQDRLVPEANEPKES